MSIRLAPAMLLAIVAAPGAWGASPVGFQRDVQPILAEHCAQCHGVDKGNRKSGLRLDRRDSALKGGDSGAAAIVPGQPDDSEVIRRITSTDATELMPPPKH